ncbi:MAG TPA: hypothetical protein VK540_15875 [Polyangiaceae bacterium]|nr:hypothetical protein [Polyangiaceae bacterium]
MKIAMRARLPLALVTEHGGHTQACNGACSSVRDATEDLMGEDASFKHWVWERWRGFWSSQWRSDGEYTNPDPDPRPPRVDDFFNSDGRKVATVYPDEVRQYYREKLGSEHEPLDVGVEYGVSETSDPAWKSDRYDAKAIAGWPGHPAMSVLDAERWLALAEDWLGRSGPSRYFTVSGAELERMYLHFRNLSARVLSEKFGSAILPPPHSVGREDAASAPRKPPSTPGTGPGRPGRVVRTGDKFGWLVVQREIARDEKGRRRFECLCTGHGCAKVKPYRLDKLTARGKAATVSCGECWGKKQRREFLERESARTTRRLVHQGDPNQNKPQRRRR